MPLYQHRHVSSQHNTAALDIKSDTRTGWSQSRRKKIPKVFQSNKPIFSQIITTKVVVVMTVTIIWEHCKLPHPQQGLVQSPALNTFQSIFRPQKLHLATLFGLLQFSPRVLQVQITPRVFQVCGHPVERLFTGY